MSKAPKPKGRKSTGEMKIVEDTISPVEVVETIYELPKAFFGKIVRNQEEKEKAIEELKNTIAEKMAQGKELSENETGFKLSLEPKVNVFIPRSKQDPKGAVETVSINGYRYEIMKGTSVDVPKSVANILFNFLKSEELLIDSSIENDNDKKAALD